MQEVYLTTPEFDALPEYSCTIPTGTTEGKRWKRRHPYREEKNVETSWYMGEYAKPKNGKVPIIWYRICIVSKKEKTQ